MNIDHVSLFASQIGSKLQTEFFKLFSGDIEQNELIRNEPEAPLPGQLESQQIREPFLDRN
jgi:hypothetical protein